ncbi:hypothetical protein GLOIN_2v1881922 [Rhizophagus irregularis DAOM 181602=DAOM 197198]|nr:hypothetical protein RirG_056870 [Rhizophagus irregularis DAOM 197198w]GBC16095.1 hypothetical protein GLOIN_2v1881922 [Rhizophagus irregularis DAOM 181602=DAOM 197198]CAG8738511.1 16347_t:CDS:1 [Rhizophagus irregularis]
MNWYFKFSYQQAKHLRQDKQQLKKNNLPDSQKNQTVILNDIQSKLNSIQQKNLSDEDSILLKCYKVEKKAHNQMCLLINNNWWYSWAYKKTKNIVNNIVIDLTTT